MKKWEKEIENPISEEEWENIFEIIHKTSIANKYQERNYKIAMRWYWSPVALNIVNKVNTETCWRCKVERGTMDHVWYSCQGVRSFWDKIFEIYQKVSGVERSPNISTSLFSLTSDTIRVIKIDILHHMTTAARTIIAQNWKKKKQLSQLCWNGYVK